MGGYSGGWRTRQLPWTLPFLEIRVSHLVFAFLLISLWTTVESHWPRSGVRHLFLKTKIMCQWGPLTTLMCPFSKRSLFRRVCLGPLNSNIHLCTQMHFVHDTFWQHEFCDVRFRLIFNSLYSPSVEALWPNKAHSQISSSIFAFNSWFVVVVWCSGWSSENEVLAFPKPPPCPSLCTQPSTIDGRSTCNLSWMGGGCGWLDFAITSHTA